MGGGVMYSKYILPRIIFLAFLAAILISISHLALADSRDNLKSVIGEQKQNLIENERRTGHDKKPVYYQRTDYVWPYVTGPYYGDAPASLLHSPHYLRTLAGSFDTRKPITNLPGELHKSLEPISQIGMQYFILQFTPDAFDNGGFQKLRKEYENMGVQFFDYLPNRAYIVLLAQTNYALISGFSSVKFIEPYHPAFKISPGVGRTPLLDPVKAVSPIYSLNVMVFPNEQAELIAMQISKMGGSVKKVLGDTIILDIDRNLISNIANIEAVRAIYEEIPIVLYGEETTSTIQVGNNIGPYMAVPYFDMGVDGGGNGLTDPQKIQVIDSGISIDAGDLSETHSTPGIPGPSHRKVYKYISTDSWGGSGDGQSCDDITSGSYTHGHVVASAALGNATDVPPLYGDPYHFYGKDDNPWKIDGVAKGALLLMYDCHETPVVGFCELSCSPGDLYYNKSNPSTLLDGYDNGARAANTGWGGISIYYDSNAQDIDNFLFDKKDAMVFVAAGNSGTNDTDDEIPEEGSVYSPANAKDAISVGMSYNSNTSSFYNPEARSYSSSVGPVGPSDKPRVKPDLMAPGDDPYGTGSNMGLDSEYACKSNDNDQSGGVICDLTEGSSGTSFASAAATGASALVRDYFAQGFYPDGTSTNDDNDSDKIFNLSGALVKAILIGSADFMTGLNLTKDYRFNYEQGYGRIQLNNVLPLVSDPVTPTGLIIDDQGLNSGSGISPGGYAQDTFEVTDATEELRIAVAWVESQGVNLANDLDLTVAFDADADGTIDSTEPQWWGNYFTEDWLEDDTGTIPVDLIRDGTLNTYEDNDGDGTLDSSQWSLRIVDIAKAFRDDLNPNEGVFIDSGDMDDKNGDGTEDDSMEGQWIWRLDAAGANPDNQRYAIAIAGGVALSSGIRFDKAPVLCADIVHVTVNEFDDGNTPNANDVSNNTTIHVIDPGPDGEFDTTDDETYDSLSGINFAQTGSAYRFASEDIPVTDATYADSYNDILEIMDGYRLRAEYNDTSEGKTKFSIVSSDCTVRLKTGVVFEQWGRDYAYLIDGGCEADDLNRSFPDKYMDVGEKFVYWIAIWNWNIDLLDADVELRAVIPDSDNDSDPGRLNNIISPYVIILESSKNIGFLPVDSAMGVPFDIEIVGSFPFPTEVEMVLGLEAKKSGKSVKEYQVFKHLLNADDEVFHYSTDFPTGGIVTRDYNNDEYVEDISGTGKKKGGQLDEPGKDWDLWYETIKFEDLTTEVFGGGNPGFNGPWNFDSDDEGFRSGIHPDSTQGSEVIANWGEDMNWDGTLQSIEDRDDANGQLDQNWALQSTSIPLCGYQTPYGIWRTGSMHPTPKSKTDCVGQGGSTSQKCQMYETLSGTMGESFFFEILRSPEVQKVHINPDANGFNYYSEFHFMTLQWNQQLDLVDDFVVVTYEVDTNTETNIGVRIDDFTVLNVFNGPMTIRDGGDGNQNLLDGFSVFAPSDSNGDEINDDLGNNRVGSRGCYFQSGDGVDSYSPHGLAKPLDDGIDQDNDGSIDEYVTFNGPIRNMDSHKNNGLKPWITLEDLYGDAGKLYEAAFGFFVAEGTTSGTPTPGYGLAIDDVVLEWDESHPIEDETDCALNGQCASISVKTISMYEANSLVPITVLDFNAQMTQATDNDSDGLWEIEILAYSEAEPDGEYFALEQTSTGSFQYSGVVPISSSYNVDGVIFIRREGNKLPTLTIRYIDEHDGAHDYSKGSDGQPGIAGFDDDDDGTSDEEDEFCPIGAGGIVRPYGDDSCGCPNNPLEISSSIEYPVGQLAIETVTVVSDNGDNDGFADACETVSIDITLKNLAKQDDTFIDLNSVVATIDSVVDSNYDGTPDDNVACILDPEAFYGSIPALESKTNSLSDRLQFQVKCDLDRTSIYQDLNANFNLNLSAYEIGGSLQALTFQLPLDLDASNGGSEVSEEFEDFDGASHKFEFIRVAHQDGTRCQYNDPDNPGSFSYAYENCHLDTFPGYMDQDWHIHDTTMPDSGRAYDGSKSIHWGHHENPSDAAGDTLHFQEMNLAAVKAENKIYLGLGNPILSFKHQLSLMDSRYTSADPGETADRAIVMVARTDNNGNVECDPTDPDLCWFKILPFDNAYHVQAVGYSNCSFDPIDDGSTEDDLFPNSMRYGPSSTCYPEFVWSWMGDTDHYNICDPEWGIGAGNGPGWCGSMGPGTWVESKFSLHQFRGYQIRFRFLATTIENWPAQHYQQAGWPTNIDGDDGWYVDDIRVTNMLDSPVTLTDDDHVTIPQPDPTCPIDSSQNCDNVTADLVCLPDGVDNDQDGTVDEEGEDNCQTLAPGHRITLSAAGSYADKCVDGALQYQFWLDGDGDGTIEETDTLLYDWSDRSYYHDAPIESTQYCVNVRCSSDTNCNDLDCYYSPPPPPPWWNLRFLDDNKITFEWSFRVNATSYDTVKGDLDELISNMGDFSTTIIACLENDDPDTQCTDVEEPPGIGQGFYYLVREVNPSGTGSYDSASGEGRDAKINSSPNSCP
jgi:hypothetical protein